MSTKDRVEKATENAVDIAKKEDVKKIKDYFAGDERKIEFALLVYNSTGWEDIKDKVGKLNYVKTHAWEMRNELANVLDRPLPCPNC